MFYIFLAYVVDFILYIMFAFFLQSYFNSGMNFTKFFKIYFFGCFYEKKDQGFNISPLDLIINNENTKTNNGQCNNSSIY